MTAATSREEFVSVIRGDSRASNSTDRELSVIFDRLHEKLILQEKDDKYKEEKYQRRHADDLRYAMKKLYPPITLDDTWDNVKHRLSDLPEYRAIKSDEIRQGAFDKYQRRLKEKEEDAARRHEKRASRAEPDAYEAERRKD